MKKDTNWLVSELVRQTRDSDAEARHTIETLREVARFEPNAMADVLGLTGLESRHMFPPLGIYLPCVWVSCWDGDTVNIRLRAGQQIAVKLIGCQTLGIHTEEGRKAAHFLESLFEKDGELRVCFPLVDEHDTQELVHVLRSFAFQPTAGSVYIGTENVSELMVRRGYATKELPNA